MVSRRDSKTSRSGLSKEIRIGIYYFIIAASVGNMLQLGRDVTKYIESYKSIDLEYEMNVRRMLREAQIVQERKAVDNNYSSGYYDFLQFIGMMTMPKS